jgi:hypothetical protein
MSPRARSSRWRIQGRRREDRCLAVTSGRPASGAGFAPEREHRRAPLSKRCADNDVHALEEVHGGSLLGCPAVARERPGQYRARGRDPCRSMPRPTCVGRTRPPFAGGSGDRGRNPIAIDADNDRADPRNSPSDKSSKGAETCRRCSEAGFFVCLLGRAAVAFFTPARERGGSWWRGLAAKAAPAPGITVLRLRGVCLRRKRGETIDLPI